MKLRTVQRCVWVVETWHAGDWYVWHANSDRKRAWQKARAARVQFPGNRFRTVAYWSDA